MRAHSSRFRFALSVARRLTNEAENDALRRGGRSDEAPPIQPFSAYHAKADEKSDAPAIAPFGRACSNQSIEGGNSIEPKNGLQRIVSWARMYKQFRRDANSYAE